MKCYATTDSGLYETGSEYSPDKRDFLMRTESHARLLCCKVHFKKT